MKMKYFSIVDSHPLPSQKRSFNYIRLQKTLQNHFATKVVSDYAYIMVSNIFNLLHILQFCNLYLCFLYSTAWSWTRPPNFRILGARYSSSPDIPNTCNGRSFCMWCPIERPPLCRILCCSCGISLGAQVIHYSGTRLQSLRTSAVRRCPRRNCCPRPRPPSSVRGPKTVLKAKTKILYIGTRESVVYYHRNTVVATACCLRWQRRDVRSSIWPIRAARFVSWLCHE